MPSISKSLRLASSFAQSTQEPLPLWVHLWVTDKCDLACDYCEVVENTKRNPSQEDLEERMQHAADLGTAVIAFMGGEPTLRADLPDLVRFATSLNLSTYVTSHGKKKALTTEKLAKLGEAGLDVIEISLDGYDAVRGSDKTLHGDESLIDRLEQMRKQYGTRYKAHQVLAPTNLDETPKLVELSRRRRLPITFGLVTEFSAFQDGRRTVYEEPAIREKTRETLQYLMEQKEQGVLILNPTRYFEDALRFLDEPLRWSCDVGTYMIQVATNGEVFHCSKYMKLTTGTQFRDIDRNYFRNDGHGSRALLARCNDRCLSACAYTTSYLRRNPAEFVRSAFIT
ncbi:radical SAM protein [Candidatus Woesearchaeota archaeon]|nr:radical SAM protein [Candidatus Woesearchaeota archaeon]